MLFPDLSFVYSYLTIAFSGTALCFSCIHPYVTFNDLTSYSWKCNVLLLSTFQEAEILSYGLKFVNFSINLQKDLIHQKKNKVIPFPILTFAALLHLKYNNLSISLFSLNTLSSPYHSLSFNAQLPYLMCSFWTVSMSMLFVLTKCIVYICPVNSHLFTVLFRCLWRNNVFYFADYHF